MVSAAARRNLEAHINAERVHDVEAVMATLSHSPHYVIPNCVLEGREAVRAMYERALKHLPTKHYDEYLRALDDPRVTRWGDDHIVLEYTDDYPLHRDMVVIVVFDGDKIKSENTYYRSAGRRDGGSNPAQVVARRAEQKPSSRRHAKTRRG
jgi:hypothetical protein